VENLRAAVLRMLHLPSNTAGALDDFTSLDARVAALPPRLGGMGWRRMLDIRAIAALSGALAAARVSRSLTRLPSLGPYPIPAPDAEPLQLSSIPFTEELGLHQTRIQVVAAIASGRPAEALGDRPADVIAALPEEVRKVAEELVTGCIELELKGPVSRLRRAQRVLTHAYEERCDAVLRPEMGPTREAHHTGNAMVGAREWVRARPCSGHTAMIARDIILAVKLRLYLPVFGDNQANTPCPSLCGKMLDAFARHAFVCKRGGRAIRRHDAVVRVLVEMARDAGCRAYEASLADSDTPPDAPKTKVDLVCEGDDSERTRNIDVSIRVLPRALDEAGDALRAGGILPVMLSAEQGKITKHELGALRLGRDFDPFILHTGGGLAPRALALLKWFKSFAVLNLGPIAAGRFLSAWITRLSCVVQRLAAHSVAAASHYSLVSAPLPGHYTHSLEAGGDAFHLRSRRQGGHVPSSLAPRRHPRQRGVGGATHAAGAA
jgi:hypothetical protein